MLGNKLLRQDIDAVCQALSRRGFIFNRELYVALEDERKVLQAEVEQLKAQRNAKSKEIGKVKAAGGNISAIMQEVNSFSEQLKSKDEKLNKNLHSLQELLSNVPNLPADEVPEGKDENDNVEIKKWGKIPQFDFSAKDHVDLGEGLKAMDFATAAKVSGSRFVILNNKIAKLQRALAQFMLDTQTIEHGYTETYVPYLVNKDSLFGTGQLPKFAEDQFNLQGEQGYSLIPTAEVPLTNIARDEIYTIDKFPLKLTAQTPCFRSEVGSYGKDKRGMFRQHQFEKIELVTLCLPEQSEQLHEELTRHAELILEKLELPYRRMLLCGGDMGFSASKTFDLEVWLPGQNQYREISSCSNFKDFQARRMQARFRNPETNKTEFIHTLNGSGLAVGRTLIAVMENYQTAEGYIRVPEALKPYMHGLEVIS